MAFITGLISFTIGAPIQIMLIRTAEGAETLAASSWDRLVLIWEIL